MRKSMLFLGILSVTLAAGCGDDKAGAGTAGPSTPVSMTPSSPGPATTGTAPVKTVDVGWAPIAANAPLYTPGPADATVSGKAIFKGDRPRRKKIDMSKDEKCVAANPKALTEDEVVSKDNSGVANVFVFVKSGYEKNKYDKPAAAVTINQEGCTYKPHVFGMMPGQTIDIMNSDETTHNIHGLPSKSKEFNFTQNKKGVKDTATLGNPEEAVKIKCDIHPWMGAWAFVLPHPFFAVSNESGAWSIKLPEGDYQIVAWHEVYGLLPARSVSVKSSESKTLEDFEFKK